MKTTALCLGRTMSGRPTIFFGAIRNRKPSRNNALRTIISGAVLRERIAAMLADRAAGERESVIKIEIGTQYHLVSRENTSEGAVSVRFLLLSLNHSDQI